LARLKALADRQDLSLHDLVRDVVNALDSLSHSQLHALSLPVPEPENKRISFYLGPEGVEHLCAVARKTGLTTSSVLRRALNATSEESSSCLVQRSHDAQASSLPFLLAIAIGILIPALGLKAGIVERRSASLQQKSV
jgi:hypothetical protein